MIGKTPRAVAVKYARPTTPRTANVAKDIFSMVIPRVCRLSFGLMGCVFIFPSSSSTQRMSYFVCTALTSTAAHKLVKTGEN